jgi:hypothetical protein
MDAAVEDLRDRLSGIAEELADLALERLRAAVDEGTASPTAAAEERRLTRARRAVEKAVAVLSEGDRG